MLDTLKRKKKPTRNFVVAADENPDLPSVPSPFDLGTPPSSTYTPLRGTSPGPAPPRRPARNLLSVDSTSLSTLALSLSDDPAHINMETALDIERRQAEEAEMAAALAEVERKRLEMQREMEARETAWGEGVQEEGVLVKRRKKKREKVAGVDGDSKAVEEGDVVSKKKTKKKKKVVQEEEGRPQDDGEAKPGEEEGVVIKKKKKKVRAKLDPAGVEAEPETVVVSSDNASTQPPALLE